VAAPKVLIARFDPFIKRFCVLSRFSESVSSSKFGIRLTSGHTGEFVIVVPRLRSLRTSNSVFGKI